MVADATDLGLVNELRGQDVHDGIEEEFLHPFSFLHAKVVLGTDSPCSLKHTVGDDSLGNR